MIAQRVIKGWEDGLWIRQMFEEGQKLKAKYGEGKVFDFSLGNPVFDPPPHFKETILKLINSSEKGQHRYMPAHGLAKTRAYLAKILSEEHELPFTYNHITMCVGAGGGLNLVLNTIVNPGEEVLILKPYFPEYKNYIANVQGIVREVEASKDFHLNLDGIEAQITKKTKAILLNSPNNPTGVIYSEEELLKLRDLLREHSRYRSSPIYLISDEPYAKILFDGAQYHSPIKFYEHSILVTSYSKELGIPGERIGYIAISPHAHEATSIFKGLAWSQLALGFVNAPALMQRMIPYMGKAKVDMKAYQENRKSLMQVFKSLGTEYVKPMGAFYFFPKTPILDDRKFVYEALSHKVVLVPGAAFGCPGHVRLSFCVEPEKVKKSLKALSNSFSKSQYESNAQTHSKRDFL